MQHVGIDIVYISRFRHLDGSWDDPFFRKTFTPAETAFCLSSSHPLVSFAEAFCAKEAVFKSLGMESDAVRLDQIEILRNGIGQPTVTLLPPLEEKAKENGITRVHLSLSYEEDLVAAFAVSE